LFTVPNGTGQNMRSSELSEDAYVHDAGRSARLNHEIKVSPQRVAVSGCDSTAALRSLNCTDAGLDDEMSRPSRAEKPAALSRSTAKSVAPGLSTAIDRDALDAAIVIRLYQAKAII
jgi:hypothetical protein